MNMPDVGMMAEELKNDNRKHIKQIHHTIIDDVKDYVIVRLED